MITLVDIANGDLRTVILFLSGLKNFVEQVSGNKISPNLLELESCVLSCHPEALFLFLLTDWQ